MHDGASTCPACSRTRSSRIDELSADLQWQIDGQAIAATVSNLKFSNADAQGEGQGSWRTGAAGARRFPGVLDLQASISRADGSKVYRYLPLGVPKTARDYVRESVVQGTATGAKFRVKGDLRDFPFKDPRLGEFRITADVRDVTYAFVPPQRQPGHRHLAGADAAERRAGVRAQRHAGQGRGRALQPARPRLQVKAEAQIPDFRHAPRWPSRARCAGRWPQALAIVNSSPVSAMTGHALAKATRAPATPTCG